MAHDEKLLIAYFDDDSAGAERPSVCLSVCLSQFVTQHIRDDMTVDALHTRPEARVLCFIQKQR